MAYRALYRQYRPRTFSEVVGQEHITTILKNQIRDGQLSHAYLFCGSRGTGKTSTAKILARAVNCDAPADGEACGVCPRCVAAAGENGDILEIDAASHTGVDDIRDLIGQAQFAPFALKYRVFIIDEAHMLSQSAFNALLKTLEEPPAHVLFILATTEPQKLPATIISRCQRFDFRRHTMANIIGYLRVILPKAGAEIEPEGLQLIARAADGSMRDALSLADQCLAFCGSRVTARDVYDVLGNMEQGFLFDTAAALLAGDAAAALQKLDEVSRMGRDLSVFAGDLGAHLRALLLAKTLGDCQQILECTADTMQRLQKQAKPAEEKLLLYMMEQVLKTQAQMRYFPQPRALLETLLVRLCRPEDDASQAALEARVLRLEQRLSAGAGQAPAPKRADSLAPEPVRADSPAPEPVRTDFPAPQPKQAAAPAQALASPEPPSLDELPPLTEPPGEPAPAPAAASDVKAAAAKKPAPAAQPAAGIQKEPDAAVQKEPAAPDAETLWQQTLARVRRTNVMLHISAVRGRAVSYEDGVMTVEFQQKDEGAFGVASSANNVRIVQKELCALAPDASLHYRMERLTGQEAQLASLFGDKLTIE